jgi:hypothetical protein
METLNEFKNPSKLFIALLDSFNTPTCIIDENENIIMNEQAKEMKELGLDIKYYSKKTKINSFLIFTHKNKKYKIDKKDINHGTNSCLCTISPEDETIIRLKESSSKLKKVLSSL